MKSATLTTSVATPTLLLAKWADNKEIILYITENESRQTVSFGDNLNDIPSPIFCKTLNMAIQMKCQASECQALKLSYGVQLFYFKQAED